MAAPATTSEAWWIRTWTRLAATTAARAYQASGAELSSDSRGAARKPDVAWPLGKLEVRCLRRWWGVTWWVVGRARRTSDFTPQLTASDSTARATARRRARGRNEGWTRARAPP